tara:strand:+ start:1120 stop:1224 length:105 start_codon:yes stop_codon:yes gene_type:complete
MEGRTHFYLWKEGRGLLSMEGRQEGRQEGDFYLY